MITINRNEDVICGNKDLEHLHTFDNFPVFMGCTEEHKDLDLSIDMSWYISKKSGVIQLKNLLPLDIVYKNEHGSGTVGKSWNSHHVAFAKFISKYDIKNVLEIGGLHGVLSQKIRSINNNVKWTIIDPNPVLIKNSETKVIEGFFDEKFMPNEEYDTIIHSHVLEHAYDINGFISHIRHILKDGVMAFSVPNMRVMLEKKFTNCVNFEHTILIGEEHVEYLLKKHGFEMLEKEYYLEDHSIFYCAKKTNNVLSAEIPINLYNKYKNMFIEYIDSHVSDVDRINKTIQNTKLPVYLFGAHVFSQYLIAFGLNTHKIIGILDNDYKKEGKRLYGTNMNSNLPKILKNIKDGIVILRAGTHNDEIKNDILNNINPDIKFI